jgi:hypothetical protein
MGSMRRTGGHAGCGGWPGGSRPCGCGAVAESGRDTCGKCRDRARWVRRRAPRPTGGPDL